MNIMKDDRIIELETKVSYQEDLLQDLNKLVVSQQQQLDQLAMICKTLSNQLKETMQRIPDESDADEKPPHY